MNDERGASAAGKNGAVASEADVARLAVQRTSHPVAGDPLALSHRDKRLIAISMMLPVFLALLWQIYSRRFLLPIHFRQCGHRFGGSRAMSATMAWRTNGKLG